MLQSLNNVNQASLQLTDLKSKHGGTLEGILNYFSQLRSRLYFISEPVLELRTHAI